MGIDAPCALLTPPHPRDRMRDLRGIEPAEEAGQTTPVDIEVVAGDALKRDHRQTLVLRHQWPCGGHACTRSLIEPRRTCVFWKGSNADGGVGSLAMRGQSMRTIPIAYSAESEPGSCRSEGWPRSGSCGARTDWPGPPRPEPGSQRPLKELESAKRSGPLERLTPIRIFEELRPLGYGGGHDAVRRYAAAWSRTEAEASAVGYVPFSFDPGEAYQFDWR